MGTVCVCREGDSPGFNSEAPPAPMLLSNSLYPDVAPQMMAGIIMNWIMTAQIWARTVTTEKKQLASPL